MPETVSMHSDEAATELEVLRAKLAEVEGKLAEAEEVIRAIQSGDVDAVVVSGVQGEQIYTLRGAEYAYRVLVEAMNEGAATLGSDGTLLYCNQRLSDLIGRPLEHLIGKPSTELFVDGSARNYQKLLRQVLSNGASKAEFELHTAEGRKVPVYVSLREMLGEEPRAISMVVTDLTERKKSDELIAAGKLATSILESAGEAIAVCDDTGMIVMGNAALEKLCGSNPLFQPLASVLPLEVSGVAGEPAQQFSIEAALEDVTPRTREASFRRNDGETFSLLLTAGRITSQTGVAGYVVTLTDITERKQAEDALRESEARFRALFDSSPDAVLLTKTTGQILAANPSACEMFGMTEEEICRVGREGLADVNDIRFARAHLERKRSGRLVKVELNFKRANGQIFPGELDSVLLPGSHGRAYVVIRDITERKRTEEALLRTEKLASVGRMASTIAHEINNPLETIGHAVYLALTDRGTSPQAKTYLEMATQELERVTHITKQTLAFNRENAKPTLIDLRETLESALNIFAPRLKSRGVSIVKRYAEVPRINAVGGEVRQIIANLLSNSMDATPQRGKIEFHICSTITRNGSKGVRLTIGDTGSGIDAERIKRIFEPFFTTKEVVGTGLGLWVTKQIVEKYGAKIQVRSKLGRGTVFSVVFSLPELSGGN